jgi:flagellar motility protein MotE (MotC chaperone)
MRWSVLVLLGAAASVAVPGLADHVGIVGEAGKLPAARILKQASDTDQCTLTEEAFAAIAEERALLERQRAELDERRAALDLARAQLEAEAAQLAEVRDRVEALLAQAEAAQAEDLQRLVNLYRNMEPEQAAVIMNDLDMETTFMVFATMAERDAAPILAELDPVLARALSRIFLERSRLPGDQDLSNLRLQ